MELTPPKPGNVVAWEPPVLGINSGWRECEIVKDGDFRIIVRIVANLSELSPVGTNDPAERWSPGRL